jgi:hypothetical protein
MSTDKHPAPGPTVKKENGKWTFYVFPDGEQREAGQYETESAARGARYRVLLQWGSNGKKYATMTAQLN